MPTVPPQMGFLFIPQQVVQEIANSGNYFDLRLQVRTGNSNARSYSKIVTVMDLTDPGVSNLCSGTNGDIDSDGDVDGDDLRIFSEYFGTNP